MQVLLTGATGFIGSSLAACFLARGFHVTCLSRGQGFLERTRSKIRDAALGFGLDVDVTQVRVLPYDIANLGARELHGVDAVWHCAAHMAFSPRALRDAMDVNVGATRLLYERVATHAQAARFFYVSTAFTGGVEAGVIDEELHLSPHLVNPYFASKWAAELILERLSREAGAPRVVIYRPTAVIGHTQTGWYGGPSYGFYNFMEGVCVARVAGGRTMRVDMAPEVQHCYLPIDDLSHNAVALTELQSPLERLTIAIDAGTYNANGARIGWIAEGMNVALEFGKPRSLADHALDLWVAVNKPFNQAGLGERPFEFRSAQMARLLGEQYHHHVLDEAMHARMIRWYDAHRLAPLERRAAMLGMVRAARSFGFAAPRKAASLLATALHRLQRQAAN